MFFRLWLETARENRINNECKRGFTGAGSSSVVLGFSEETTKTTTTSDGHCEQERETLGKAVAREPRKQVGPNCVTYPPPFMYWGQ